MGRNRPTPGAVHPFTNFPRLPLVERDLLGEAVAHRRHPQLHLGSRLLGTARLVLVVVLGGLLCGTGGATHLAVVSAVVLWLAADRLLGRRALHDLFKAVRGPK